MVQHLKTPSKTATMKKTRAKLELEKQRTDKVKNINAKLALSPSRSQNGSPVSLSLNSLERHSHNTGSTSVPTHQLTPSTEIDERYFGFAN